MTKIGNDISKAKLLLEKGEVVAIPTETVYGLAANALDEQAVAKIFEAKNRPYFNPLILHLADKETIQKYVKKIPDELLKLIDIHCPGPITFLLEKKDIVPDLVTAGSKFVAIRIPKHEICQKLLSQLNFPLAAPSANPFGYISPVTSTHVFNQLNNKIPYILEGKTANIGIESTIVGVENKQVKIFRLGGVSYEDIKKDIPNLVLANKSQKSPQTSGLLKSHYSPKKELIAFDRKVNKEETLEGDCLLTFCEYNKKINNIDQFLLSKNNNLKEATSNLFSTLHNLDNNNYKRILVELLPEKGLGRAINDRLKRASSNF